MAFQIITDMEQADKLWEEGLLYYKDTDGEWILDDYYRLDQAFLDWRPSADEEREGARNNEYAILLEE